MRRDETEIFGNGNTEQIEENRGTEAREREQKGEVRK